jgi:hypothetical protein
MGSHPHLSLLKRVISALAFSTFTTHGVPPKVILIDRPLVFCTCTLILLTLCTCKFIVPVLVTCLGRPLHSRCLNPLVVADSAAPAFFRARRQKTLLRTERKVTVITIFLSADRADPIWRLRVGRARGQNRPSWVDLGPRSQSSRFLYLHTHFYRSVHLISPIFGTSTSIGLVLFHSIFWYQYTHWTDPILRPCCTCTFIVLCTTVVPVLLANTYFGSSGTFSVKFPLPVKSNLSRAVPL